MHASKTAHRSGTTPKNGSFWTRSKLKTVIFNWAKAGTKQNNIFNCTGMKNITVRTPVLWYWRNQCVDWNIRTVKCDLICHLSKNFHAQLRHVTLIKVQVFGQVERTLESGRNSKNFDLVCRSCFKNYN